MTLFIRPSNVHEIFIINCKKIIIPANSFANLPQLSEIIFRNIEELELESNSITIIRPNQRVRILFDNVSVITNFLITQINIILSNGFR